MPIASALGGLATLASVAGTAVGIAGTLMSHSAQKKAEKLREKQMNLEAMRQTRGVVREANRQRAVALSVSTAQGSQLGSGLAGAKGQIAGQANSTTLGINQGQEIGAGIFAANRADAAGRMISGMGSGLSSLAGSLSSSEENRKRLTEYYGY